MYLEQVTNFIARIGEWVTPIIIALGGIYLAVKEIYDFFAKRKAKKETSIAVDLLGKISQSKDSTIIKENSEKIEALEKENEQLKQLVKTESSVMKAQSSILGEMLSIIFENSSLSYDVKEKLRALKTKIDCPSESGMLEELLSQNTILREEVEHFKIENESIKQQQEVKITKDTEADTVSKHQTNNTIIQ